MSTFTPAEIAQLDQGQTAALAMLDDIASHYDHLDEHEAVREVLLSMLAGPLDVGALATGVATVAVRLRRARKACTCGGEGGS